MKRRGVLNGEEGGGMRPRRLRAVLPVAVLIAATALASALAPLPGRAGAQDRGAFEPEVIGGGPVPNGKYPFLASLQDVRFGSGGDERHFCGGTLVAPDAVMTAAHCIVLVGTSPATLRVVVGQTSLTGNQGQARRVVAIRVHPDYRPRTGVYDVAVLELDRPIEGIEPIRLATGDRDLERPGRNATVAGWGSTQQQSGGPFNPPGRFPSRMQETTVPLRSDAGCAEAYAGSAGLPGNDIKRAIMICAGKEGLDTCQGDSGGPLFVQRGTDYYEIGITSFGVGCGASGYPGVYTQVSAPPVRTFVEQSIAA